MGLAGLDSVSGMPSRTIQGFGVGVVLSQPRARA